MRVNVFTGGIKNQGLSYLYLTDEEISRYGLEPTNYEGKIYNWITLPKRDDFAEPGERLVAAYGGNLSEICCSQPETDIYNAANVCFYTLPGWSEGGSEEELDYLPNDLREKLCNAIKEHCGTYNSDDFENPFFDGDRWIERDEAREQNFMSLSDVHKIVDQEQEDVWIKTDDKQYQTEPDEKLKHTFGNTTVEFGIRHFPNKERENPVNILILKDISNGEPNGTSVQLYVKGNIDTAERLVDNTIKHFDQKQDISMLDIASYLDSKNLEVKLGNPQNPTVQLAKKAGYVQGVCECVAAIGGDYFIGKKVLSEMNIDDGYRFGKKLLSEMNVTKDMAKKYANPETYKALEQGIFAPRQEQEQSLLRGSRSMFHHH